MVPRLTKASRKRFALFCSFLLAMSGGRDIKGPAGQNRQARFSCFVWRWVTWDGAAAESEILPVENIHTRCQHHQHQHQHQHQLSGEYLRQVPTSWLLHLNWHLPTNYQYCKQMLTSLVASILVVVLLLVPLPPWIPHSTKLSFNEDNLEEDFEIIIRCHPGIG